MQNSIKLAVLLMLCLLVLSPAYASVRTGTIVAAPVTVGDSTNTFPTAYEDEINGGYKVVSDEATMNSIPASRRVVGMLCYVSSEATTFRLNSGNTWVADSSSAKGGGWISGGGRVTLETAANNVGVGTSNPGYKLDVYQSTTGNDVARLINAGTGNASIVMANTNGTTVALAAGASTVRGFIGTTTNHDFQLQVNNNPIVYAMTSGKVGINSTNPGASLEVKGDLKLVPTSTPTDTAAGKMYFSNSTNRMYYADGSKWIEIDPAYTTSSIEALKTGPSYYAGSVAYGVTSHVNMGTLPSGNDSIITSVILQMAVAYGAGGSPAHNLDIKVRSGSSNLLADFVYPYDAYNASNGPFVYTFPIPVRATAGSTIYLDVSCMDSVASNTSLTLTNSAVMFHHLPL
ncbi:MAG TPA: hypothetical protein VMD02_05685 [Candidatus Omnitrophota bacterium]|nr:hypothetical protein [Candidatus Omnitrophota bacterium]